MNISALSFIAQLLDNADIRWYNNGSHPRHRRTVLLGLNFSTNDSI